MDNKTTESIIAKIQENAPLHFMKKMKKDREGTGFILSYLYCHKDKAVYSKDLATDCRLSTARIAAALNGLEESGLIERTDCPEDKRKTLVKLTESGIEKCIQLKEEMYTFCGKVIEDKRIH